MSKIVREAGGFYYEVNDYGERRPVNVSVGTECIDGIIEGAPIAIKISLVLMKFIVGTLMFIRNKIMVEEDVEKFLSMDEVLRKDFGGGFFGNLIAFCLITSYGSVVIFQVVYSIVHRLVKVFTK